MSERQRRERGSKIVFKEGTDRASGLPRYACRFVTDGKRTYYTLTSTTLDAARLEFAGGRERVRKGLSFHEAPPEPVVAPPAKVTVDELARRYVGWSDDKRARFTTGAGEDNRRPVKYRRQFWSVLDCHVLPHVGQLAADDVTRADLVRMVDALQGVGARTVEKAIRHTSKLFNWAADRELVSGANPALRLRGPKYKSKSDYYTDAELAAMMATAAKQGSELYPIIATAAYGGLRKGELAALERRDVDLDGARMTVQRSWKASARKSGEALTVHLHPHLLIILTAHLEAQGDRPGDSLVFPAEDDRMRDEFDLWGLGELVTAAKARRFKRPWHSFRHSFGTNLAASGASLAEVQEALGQQSLEMARRYVKVAGESIKKRVQALPNLGPVVDLGAARRSQSVASSQFTAAEKGAKR